MSLYPRESVPSRGILIDTHLSRGQSNGSLHISLHFTVVDLLKKTSLNAKKQGLSWVLLV